MHLENIDEFFDLFFERNHDYKIEVGSLVNHTR